MTKNSKNVVEKTAAKKTAAVKAPKAAAKKAETAAPAKETKTTVKKVAKPAKAAAPKKVGRRLPSSRRISTTIRRVLIRFRVSSTSMTTWATALCCANRG